MLIGNVIEFRSHLKLPIIVVAVTKSFPFNPRHNCRCTETAEELSPRLPFIAAAFVLFANSLSEAVGWTSTHLVQDKGTSRFARAVITAGSSC